MFRGQFPGVPILWLDTGGFAGDTTKAGQYQTETLLEGMSRLGYAAVNVTARELEMGLEEFRAMAAAVDEDYPLISSNIVTQDDREPVFPPYVVKTFEPGEWRGSSPLRLGIVGVTREDRAFLQKTADGKRVIILPPAQAAARWVAQAAGEADVVVLLAAMNATQVDSMLQRLPGVDMVLAGDGARVSDNFALPPEPSVVYSGDQGKRIGEIRLFMKSTGIASLTKKHIFLDQRYPYDPRMKTFEDDANIKINDYYRAAAYSTAPAADREAPLSARYVGSGQCQECHAEAFDVWHGSAHAHAMQILVDARQEYNPLCTPCHVTGGQRPTGFQNLKATPDLADVHCEECHGPAGAHMEDFQAPYGKTDSAACLKCHTGDNSPTYDFMTYWEQIKH